MLRCMSIRGVDLVPTIVEYTALLQVPSYPTQIYVSIQQYRAYRELANFLGLKYGVVSPEIRKVGTMWRHANISFGFLASRISRSQCSQDYIGDFISGEQGWEKLRIRAFLIAFSSIIIFPSSASKIDLGVVPLVDSLSEDLSIVPTLVTEIVRSLSYCRSHGAGVPMFCA